MNRSVLTVMCLSGLTGAVVVLLGMLVVDRMTTSEIVITAPVSGPTSVVISGEVNRPGVYTFGQGAVVRVADVIQAAGGTTTTADTTGMNLAARCRDGQQLSIPSIQALSTPQTDVAPMVPADEQPAGSLISINTATAGELEALPGIGPVLAARIVDYRLANGPFQSVDDLAQVDGISPSLVEELRRLVTVDG